MKIHRLSATILAFLLLPVLFAATLHAQVMPQDTWRYDNLQFSAPDPTRQLTNITIGTGGVYVETQSPVSILQFQENGVFIRQFSASFTDIIGMACDSSGNLYVFDSGDSKVKVYSATGTFLRQWGGPGAANGLFGTLQSYQTMLAVDRNNQVYVCDPGNARVQVFDTNGNFLRKWGDPGSLPGQFSANTPAAIVAGPNGWMYVNGNAMVVFDAQGNYLKSNQGIYGVASMTPDGLLVSRGNNNASIYDQTLANVGTTPSEGSLYGVACNARGDVFALTNYAVKVYEREYWGVQNSLLPPAIPHPVVLTSAQRDGTAWLDVDYKVTDVDSATVTTAAAAFINGGSSLASLVPMRTFREGTAANIGAAVATGATKHLTWDMAADWSVDFAQIQVEVLAKDARNPLGIHWITIPADGALPALQVSKRQVSDWDLTNLWFWYAATGFSKVTRTGDKMTAVTGGYSGTTLAQDYFYQGNFYSVASTEYGRAFAFEQLGIRAIRPAEITRANAGSYGFTAVDANSVVREVVVPAQIVVVWGYYSGGVPAWVQSLGVAKIASSAADQWGNLALLNNGTVVGWDNNGTPDATIPAGLTSVTAIAKGGTLSLALKSDGTVTGWGTPAVPAGLTGITAIAAGYDYGLALKNDGTVTAWGDNSYGQTTVPAGLTGVTAISAGYNHSLARKSDGTVVAWGYGAQGQTSVPAGLTGVTAVATGNYHSLARKNDGTVVA